MRFSTFRDLFRDALENSDPDVFIAERGWQDWMDAYGGDTDRLARDMRYIWDAAHIGVRAIRDRVGASQAGFARRFGIPTRTYEAWEMGERRPPPYVVMLLAYAAFGE